MSHVLFQLPVMFDVLTIEIRERESEDIKRESLERHVIIYQDVIIGSCAVLPAQRTTRKDLGI